MRRPTTHKRSDQRTPVQDLDTSRVGGCNYGLKLMLLDDDNSVPKCEILCAMQCIGCGQSQASLYAQRKIGRFRDALTRCVVVFVVSYHRRLKADY